MTTTPLSKYCPVQADEPYFNVNEARFLGSICVGILKNSTDLTTAVKSATSVTKLTESTYPTWFNQVSGLLQTVKQKRAIGLLEDSVEGSVAAYRRYFGEPATWKGKTGDAAKNAVLLPVEVAEAERDDEIAEVRRLLVSTFSPEVCEVLGEAFIQGLPLLWTAIRERYSVDPRAAKRMVIDELDNYQPTKDKAMSIVGDELAVLFSKYYTMTGGALLEDDKMRYFFSAAKIVAAGRNELETELYAIKREHGKESYSFERARKELTLLDKSVAKVVVAESTQRKELHDQAQAPHMFQARAQPHPDNYGPVMWPYDQYGIYLARGGQPNFGPSQPTMQRPYQNRQPRLQGGGPRRCYGCGKEGHIARNCDDRMNGRPATTYYDTQGNLRAEDGTIIRYFYEERGMAGGRNQSQMMPRDNGYQRQQGNSQRQAGQAGGDERAIEGPLPPQVSTLNHTRPAEVYYEIQDDSARGEKPQGQPQ